MHKPIIHRKCGKRVPDGDERIDEGRSQRDGDEVCTCWPVNDFRARPEPPPDLQWHDKYDK